MNDLHCLTLNCFLGTISRIKTMSLAVFKRAFTTYLKFART
ncbi:hypothetical protein Pint_09554 [Pistacia integerrima]|uniref:Uncharacterized protein n=2 Tax=Pistacia integerrima TaxID=434235 RepID=A0ACC0XF65_9ROSI|nr:hypothetical protein Pint_09669 [Pistacia integerrima]KAJ0017241.1 hypothetical protein Pint_09554 [Pistacia integerrima]